MLKKRVMFTLLYDRGSFMLSRNFTLQKVGNLRWLQKNYNFSQVAFSIDELVILDVSRGERDFENYCETVKALTEGCFAPITAGGGIRDVEQARKLLQSGADKVILNSAVDGCPTVIQKIAEDFGRQCIVASVDVKMIDGVPVVLTENGTKQQDISLTEWLEKVVSLPVGELYLNSVDRDGTGQGYDLDLLECLPKEMKIPLILAGGAGKAHHLSEGLEDKRVDAVTTAHLFNFVGDGLIKAREYLLAKKMDLAVWDREQALAMKNIFIQ